MLVLTTIAGPGVLAASPARAAETVELLASDATANAGFGSRLALTGDVAVIGAPGTVLSSAGAAYVFRRDGTSWLELSKLAASDSASGDQLGSSVALHGETTILGAEGDDDNGVGAGSAYLFRVPGPPHLPSLGEEGLLLLLGTLLATGLALHRRSGAAPR
jgi:hypothetical protein